MALLQRTHCLPAAAQEPKHRVSSWKIFRGRVELGFLRNCVFKLQDQTPQGPALCPGRCWLGCRRAGGGVLRASVCPEHWCSHPASKSSLLAQAFLPQAAETRQPQASYPCGKRFLRRPQPQTPHLFPWLLSSRWMHRCESVRAAGHGPWRSSGRTVSEVRGTAEVILW